MKEKDKYKEISELGLTPDEVVEHLEQLVLEGKIIAINEIDENGNPDVRYIHRSCVSPSSMN